MRDRFSNIGRPQRVAAWSLLLSLACLVGCGDGKIKRYPVTGTVNIDGQPADGAMVIFCPVGGSEELQKLRPYGITGSDGKFVMNTLENSDGVPVGEYKILIQWPAKTGGDGRDGAGMGPDRLRGRYMNLEKSQLTATVKEEPNDLPPYELKLK